MSDRAQGFTFLTLDRTGMGRWTRKRRRKFQKRWLRQHGFPFRLFVSQYKCYVDHALDTMSEMVFHVRYEKDHLGRSSVESN